MKKLLSVLLVLAMSVSMLAACGSSEEPAATTDSGSSETTKAATEETTEAEMPAEVVEMTFVYAGGDPLVKELTSERVQAFNAAFPQYNISEIPSGSGGYLDFVKTQDAIGEFPDMLDSRDTTVWVEADKLAELPTSVVDMLNEPPMFDGKYYVAPISIALPSIGFYYNKAMFDELGLEEPTTRAEFIALCDAISASGTAPIVQGGKDIWHMGFLWGQTWVEEVFKTNPEWLLDKYAGEASFTDPEVLAMIDKLSSFYENGFIEKGWLSTADNQIVSYLLAEKAAMFFSGSWMINQVAEADPSFELGWFPLPDEDGSLNLIYAPTLAGFALSKEAATDPGKVALFEEFTKFFYAEENYGPYLAGVVQAPSIKEEIAIDYGSEFPTEFAEALANAAYTDSFWNGKWGDEMLPGGFRNYAYKAFQEKIANGSSALELGELLDKQWQIEVETTN